MQQYDYIITGSGTSGLMLAYRMAKDSFFDDASILIIDKEKKTTNDRTWCFWEKKEGVFESIVHAKWNTLEFISTNFQEKLDLGAYTYKMIQGIDFYNFVINLAHKFSNVTFLQESIVSITSNENTASVKTADNSYLGNVVFNSTAIFNPKITEENSLLQHFKGWVIKTAKPAFTPEVGRLMDFGVSQKNGTTFMYVLPTSSTEALIEYTLFTTTVLEKEMYNTALKKYIKEELKIENYSIVHEEFGVIPMSLAKFEKNPQKNIINIGTAGGFTKASSGYTFQFIQKDVSEIVTRIKLDKDLNINTSFENKLYNWYDRTLIDVLLSEKLTGREIFTEIFQKNSPEKILAFLGNESTLLQDITIMTSLPIKPFLSSGIKQLLKKN